MSSDWPDDGFRYRCGEEVDVLKESMITLQVQRESFVLTSRKTNHERGRQHAVIYARPAVVRAQGERVLERKHVVGG